MAELSASTTIDAPAAAVWSLLADFGAIEAWWPRDGEVRIERVECEGDGVGMIRHVYNVGAKGCVSERLDFLDPENRTLILSIVGERPAGITAYVAIGVVTEQGAQQCRFDYRAYVSAAPERERKVEALIEATWARMFAGLAMAARSAPPGAPPG